jgi:hypothetical protein
MKEMVKSVASLSDAERKNMIENRLKEFGCFTFVHNFFDIYNLQNECI